MIWRLGNHLSQAETLLNGFLHRAVDVIRRLLLEVNVIDRAVLRYLGPNG